MHSKPLSGFPNWRMMLHTLGQPGQRRTLPAWGERFLRQQPVWAVLVAVVLGVLASPSLGAQGREFTGKVLGVSDGGTITVRSSRTDDQGAIGGHRLPGRSTGQTVHRSTGVRRDRYGISRRWPTGSFVAIQQAGQTGTNAFWPLAAGQRVGVHRSPAGGPRRFEPFTGVRFTHHRRDGGEGFSPFRGHMNDDTRGTRWIAC